MKSKKLKFDDWLKHITVIVDSREKENSHIIDCLEVLGVKWDITGLPYGDYICEFQGTQIECVVERKNSLDELSQNFTTNRERFKREWDKVPFNHNKHLIIEENTLNDIFTGNHRSRIHQNSFLASFLSFQAKYNIKIHFVEKCYMGIMLLRLFYYNHYYFSQEAEKVSIKGLDARILNAKEILVKLELNKDKIELLEAYLNTQISLEEDLDNCHPDEEHEHITILNQLDEVKGDINDLIVIGIIEGSYNIRRIKDDDVL
jgi:hypothetical protein